MAEKSELSPLILTTEEEQQRLKVLRSSRTAPVREAELKEWIRRGIVEINAARSFVGTRSSTCCILIRKY